MCRYPPSQSDLLRPRTEGFNFSSIPPTARGDGDDGTHSEFPLFSSTKPLHVKVEQGELLYLPFGWWHTVTGEGFNVIVNHWHAMRPEKKFAVDPAIKLDGAV